MCTEVGKDQEPTSAARGLPVHPSSQHVQYAKITLGHSCQQGVNVISVTIKQSILFFSLPLGFVFLHGFGVGGAFLEAK